MYRHFYKYFVNYIQPQELYNELYIHVLCTSNLQKNYQMLKTSLVNHTRHLVQYRINRLKHQGGSVDDTNLVDNNYSGDTESKDYLSTISTNNIPTFEQSFDTELELDNMELLNTIDSIPNKEVRDILVVTGYLIANLYWLRGKYLELLQTANKKVQNKLLKLQEKTTITEKRVRRICIKDVIRALDIDFTEDKTLKKSEKVNNTLQELQYYLMECNLISI